MPDTTPTGTNAQAASPNPTPAVEVNLLPCPFCGGPALSGKTFDDGCYVSCMRDACKCIVGYFDILSEAITAWNTRTPSRGGEVEKLREGAKDKAIRLIRDLVVELETWEPELLEVLRFTPQAKLLREWIAKPAALASPPPVDADTPAASGGAAPAEVEELRRTRDALEYAIERMVTLTPSRANASDAQDLHCSIRAIGFSALAKSPGYNERPGLINTDPDASPKPASDTGTRVEAGEGQ